MEIKLADTPRWKISAIIWFVFSVIQFWGFVLYDSIVYLIAGILGAIQGIYFLTRMTNLTYLTLKNEILTIHLRKLPLGKKRIIYGDISKGEVIGKEIKLHLKNGKIIKLRNDWISYDNFSKLKKELEAHSITIS
ncbi:hypothetical protein ACFSTA_03730 [Ornithinibacillus salinisoli]|uniref:Pore-forming protein n=1 Tax=Ornithinibacillus salinisoli TaxID=1848459 RepID=A0ABW4VYU5_9BACI